MPHPTVLLISASKFYTQWGLSCPKHELFELFAFLSSQKIDVGLLDLELKCGVPRTGEEVGVFKDRCRALLSRQHFDIAAISCWTSLSYLSSVEVAGICKEINRACTTVVGGYHPTAAPEDFLYDGSPFDFVVLGDGEAALLDIVRGDEVRSTKPRTLIGRPTPLALDPVSFYSYYERLEDHLAPTRPPGVRLFLSRGCPFKCSFCMEQAKPYSKWRCYSVTKAIEFIKFIDARFDSPSINILDACFGLDRSWRREFFSRLVKCKSKRTILLEGRIDLFDKQDVDLLAQMDIHLNFGVESFSEQMLLLMNKTKSPRSYLRHATDVMGYLNKKGMSHTFFLIFNHPGETHETYRETIDHLRNFLKTQRRMSGLPGPQNFAYFPGSQVHRHIKSYERLFGTEVRFKQWWKVAEVEELRDLATAITASRSLKERFGDDATYWQKEVGEIVEGMIRKNPSLLAQLAQK